VSVFESRVLRRIFGLKRNEVIGDWRKLHEEELHFKGTHSEPTKSMCKDGALHLTVPLVCHPTWCLPLPKHQNQVFLPKQ
jgi:hypothetical protein